MSEENKKEINSRNECFSDIDELDFILAQLEDYLYGEESKLISKARNLVSKIKKKYE